MVSSLAINMRNGTNAVTRSEVPTPVEVTEESLESQKNGITAHYLENIPL